MNFYFFLSLGLASCALTAIVRAIVRRYQVIDYPNHRSAHVIPTPRGGGIAFVVVFLMALIYLYQQGQMNLASFLAFVGAGLGVALLGFIDDIMPVSPPWRLLAQLLLVGWGLYWLGGMPAVGVAGFILPPGVLLTSFGTIALVWGINLYNFMDGINGLAAVELISVGFIGALLMSGNAPGALVDLPLILAASVSGFLLWNFPRARIFMGDVGSGFLGLILGLIVIQSAALNQQLLWGWLILLGVFIVDSTVTLLCRAVQGDRLFAAHCGHAYQQASRFHQSHVRVTLAVLVINLCWLFPLAMLVVKGYVRGELGLLVAYTPLVILVLKYRRLSALILPLTTKK